MPTSKKTYIVTPADGTAPYEIKADHYSFVEQSGRHLFRNGEGEDAELIANLLNVGVRLAN